MLCALGLVAAFACTEEIAPLAPEVPEVTVPENLVEMTITASQDETKSTFDGKTIGWELTDVVAVYDGVEKREFTVASIDGQTGAATLKGYVDANATSFQAVYPYSAAGDKLPADGKINISVPATQKLVEGAVVAPGALVSVGEIVEGKVAFKNVVSLLKVKVTEDMTSVSIKGVKYENIAGDATATVAAMTSEGGAANVVLKPVGEKFVAGEYYIALLPTTFADGFTVAYRKESGLAVLKSGTAVEFPANGGFDVTGKDLSTLTWLTNPLMSESDLKTYLENQDSYAGEAVSLGKDITLTEAWTPVALTGNLDGAGYTISGLNVEVNGAGNLGGMFTTIDTDASLKNVTIQGAVSYSTSAATSYAGLAGELKGTMYKVINKASVTVASTGNNRCYPGGLVGVTRSGSIVECENHGAVTLSSASCASFIGGLVGAMSTPGGLVQNSNNYGTVTSNSSKVEGLGGIVGIQQSGTVEGCTNSGTLALESGAGNSYVGGITGYVQNRSTAKLLISNCTNRGTFRNSTTPMAVGGICGVLHRYCTASAEINGCTNETELAATITKSEFYLGGIVGRMANPGTGTPGAHTNYIKNCENYGSLTVDKTSTTETSYMMVGGILSVVLGQMEMSGNTNYAQSISLTDANAKNACVHSGGIVAKTDDTEIFTFSSNVNRANISFKTDNNEVHAGGLIGYCVGPLNSSNNINFGDVEMTTSATSNGNAFAGGMVGAFGLATGESASMTADKSFGFISSVGRAGLCIGVSRSANYGTIALSNCVVGGKLYCKTNGFDFTISNDNYNMKKAQNNTTLISYYKTTNTTFTESNTTFGYASTYDK